MNAVGPTIRYATRDDWAAFLAPLNVAVQKAPDRQTFIAFCAACADSLAVRADWLTPQRRREAMTTFDYWPSIAKVAALFEADKAHAAFMATRQDTSGQLPAPEPRRAMTDAVRAANLAKVSALKADLAATIAKHGPKATPRYLTPDQLRATYEARAAAGCYLAKARLETLR